MKKILIINGPNMALLGKRQPEIYGETTLQDIETSLKKLFKNKLDLEFYQNDIEGNIVSTIGTTTVDAIVINAAAYTHTSIAIADALSSKNIPYIEIHISNVHSREQFRHKSYISKNAIGVICGLGIKGYEYALNFLYYENKS